MIGGIGERAAEELLVKKGYEVVLRNFSTRFGEIDLIVTDNGCLVFVEVKTKKGLEFGLPEEMFTRGKYNKVKRMATVYLASQELLLRGKKGSLLDNVPCRIDMVAVELDGQNSAKDVRHYENVVFT